MLTLKSQHSNRRADEILRKTRYLYLEIYLDGDITHVTTDVKKEWILLRIYFTGFHFRIADFKSERKFVYEIRFV
jgi:hypothetical protein